MVAAEENWLMLELLRGDMTSSPGMPKAVLYGSHVILVPHRRTRGLDLSSAGTPHGLSAENEQWGLICLGFAPVIPGGSPTTIMRCMVDRNGPLSQIFVAACFWLHLDSVYLRFVQQGRNIVAPRATTLADLGFSCPFTLSRWEGDGDMTYLTVLQERIGGGGTPRGVPATTGDPIPDVTEQTLANLQQGFLTRAKSMVLVAGEEDWILVDVIRQDADDPSWVAVLYGSYVVPFPSQRVRPPDLLLAGTPHGLDEGPVNWGMINLTFRVPIRDDYHGEKSRIRCWVDGLGPLQQVYRAAAFWEHIEDPYIRLLHMGKAVGGDPAEMFYPQDSPRSGIIGMRTTNNLARRERREANCDTFVVLMEQQGGGSYGYGNFQQVLDGAHQHDDGSGVSGGMNLYATAGATQGYTDAYGNGFYVDHRGNSDRGGRWDPDDRWQGDGGWQGAAPPPPVQQQCAGWGGP